MAVELDGLARSGELGRLAVEHGPTLAPGLAALLTARLQVCRTCSDGKICPQHAVRRADSKGSGVRFRAGMASRMTLQHE